MTINELIKKKGMSRYSLAKMSGIPWATLSDICSGKTNPAFLGFDLLYIGMLFMYFNWGLCVVTVFAVLMYHLQIVNVEEDFLQAAFGEEYLQYQKKVCRYIGRKR